MTRTARPYTPRDLSHEHRRRGGCRHGLPGLSIRLDTGEASRIRGTFWDRDSQLVVIVEGGRLVPAEACTLLERWPVQCCRPSGPVRPPGPEPEPDRAVGVFNKLARADAGVDAAMIAEFDRSLRELAALLALSPCVEAHGSGCLHCSLADDYRRIAALRARVADRSASPGGSRR